MIDEKQDNSLLGGFTRAELQEIGAHLDVNIYCWWRKSAGSVAGGSCCFGGHPLLAPLSYFLSGPTIVLQTAGTIYLSWEDVDFQHHLSAVKVEYGAILTPALE